VSGIFFGESSSRPILISNVGCHGRERSLFECSWSATAASTCTHDSDVELQCQGMRIVYNYDSIIMSIGTSICGILVIGFEKRGHLVHKDIGL